ncbi:MAG: AMIN domain-containing protein, partial [Bdellovibrionales bacterium]|nr:AMIN domain-containing protein [Bdellovibrionales bacterium]
MMHRFFLRARHQALSLSRKVIYDSRAIMIHQPKLARLPVIKATTLLLLSLYPLIGGAEERILEFEGAGIKISAYSDTTPSEKLTLRVESSQVDNVEIFTVNEPNRLVIDLLGVQFKSHDEFSLKSNRFAERLRLGAHKNKMRLVLDLLGADFPKYLYRQKTGQLEIELGESGDSKILEGVVDKPIAQAPTQSPLPRPRVISVMKQTPETLASSVEPSP